MKHAVVAGVTGQVGRALAARLRIEGRQVIGVSRTAAGPLDVQLDLATEPSTWPAWPAADVTFICIGAGGLETCARDPAGTRRVNVDAVAAVARHATAAGSRVVFISSSHVVDGAEPIARPSDPRQPQTEYGRQKADAEVAVLAQPGAAVLRCSKIFGPGDLRLGAWRRALLSGQPFMAFDDLYVAPISMEEAVAALTMIGDAGEPGLFQLSGSEDTTYYSLALALARHLGVDPSLVLHRSAVAAGVPLAFRPRGVRLEQRLPRPMEPAALDVVIARALSE
jgi:dTDP-4-dehydrorhamnose reductase